MVIFRLLLKKCILFCSNQPGMHVNGAPQMMQPPAMGVVPGPMPGPGPGPGPAPGQGGPPGKRYTACISNSSCDGEQVFTEPPAFIDLLLSRHAAALVCNFS